MKYPGSSSVSLSVTLACDPKCLPLLGTTKNKEIYVAILILP